MNCLLWITDAHLDHLSDAVGDARLEKLGKSRADMLLLGGDTADARVFSRMLRQIGEVFPGKVALVAGNHDSDILKSFDQRAVEGNPRETGNGFPEGGHSCPPSRVRQECRTSEATLCS